MVNRRILRVGIALMSILLLLGGLLSWVVSSAQETSNMAATAPVADSVRFGADLRAGEKPVELVGQYAWTSVNGDVVQSDYSTEPRPMETGSFGLAGEACVYGGAGPGCPELGGAASAHTTEGNMERLDESFTALLGIGLATTNAEVEEPLATGARCYINEDGFPEGEGIQPSGVIDYGSDALLSLQWRSLDINEIANGETRQVDRRVGALLGLLGLLSGTTVEVEALPSWGWDPDALRAHSELHVRYRGLLRNDIRPWMSFSVRSECGMVMSDGSGSNAPAGIAFSPQAAPFAQGQSLQPSTASGSPRDSGFSAEDSLRFRGGRFHLLATRELNPGDHLLISEVLADVDRPEAGAEGEGRGARWKLFSAAASGEQVPVLEIEFGDGAIVQVRPDLPGVRLPSPDVVVASTEPTTSPPRTTSPQPSTPTTSTTTSHETPTPSISPSPPPQTLEPTPAPAPESAPATPAEGDVNE